MLGGEERRSEGEGKVEGGGVGRRRVGMGRAEGAGRRERRQDSFGAVCSPLGVG